MTYDRAVIKMDQERVEAANQTLYGPPPTVESIVPTSKKNGHEWRYTTVKPGATWTRPDFDVIQRFSRPTCSTKTPRVLWDWPLA